MLGLGTSALLATFSFPSSFPKDMPKLEISYEMLLKWKKSAYYENEISMYLLKFNSSFTPKKVLFIQF